MSEVRWYAAGGAAAFIGLALLALRGPGWLGTVLLLCGLGAAALGLSLAKRRSSRLGFEIEDEHLHPVPVLDAPKGTFDLISGMTVRVRNDSAEPIGVRIDTVLYHRTAWGWDQAVEGAARRTLLAPSVVGPRTTKPFIVRNTTRLPEEIDELGPRHFVKLVVETAGLGSSVRRVFLKERFELPKPSAVPLPDDRAADERSPLLPFSEELERGPVARSAKASKLAALAARLEGKADVVKVHPLRDSDDSLKGLIDEINAEIEEETGGG